MLIDEIKQLHQKLDDDLVRTYNRSLPFNENISDRWGRAKKLGFGEGTSIYDSSLVFHPTTVGKNCWIGPFTIIDGSGGLTIGESCTISAGVHIYTHDNIEQTLLGRDTTTPIVKTKVIIGNNTYVGPHSVISKGTTIGHHCVIAANSFVNSNVPDYSIVAGNPAKLVGKVEVLNGKIKFIYQ
jgi:acetyltransferase-like isoleucine patch superfamily enzyme